MTAVHVSANPATWVEFATMWAAIAWAAVVTIVAKGSIRRLDAAEVTIARQREALAAAAQTIAMAGLLLPDQVEAWLADRDLEVN